MSAALIGLIAAFCWGICDFFAAISSRSIGQLRTAVGVTLAGHLAITLWLVTTATLPVQLLTGAWLPLLSGGLIALATLWLFAALALGPLSVALPFVMSYPASTLAIAAAMGRPPGLLQIFAATAVLAGVILVARGEAGEASRWASVRKCISFALLSHAAFAVGTTIGQHAATQFGTLDTTWLQRTGGVAVILAAWILSKDAKRIPLPSFPVLLAIGVLDIIAIGLLNHAGLLPNPEIAIVGGSSAVLVTILLAWLILKERIAPLRWFGIAVSFLGVATLSFIKG